MNNWRFVLERRKRLLIFETKILLIKIILYNLPGALLQNVLSIFLTSLYKTFLLFYVSKTADLFQEIEDELKPEPGCLVQLKQKVEATPKKEDRKRLDSAVSTFKGRAKALKERLPKTSQALLKANLKRLDDQLTQLETDVDSLTQIQRAAKCSIDDNLAEIIDIDERRLPTWEQAGVSTQAFIRDSDVSIFIMILW